MFKNKKTYQIVLAVAVLVLIAFPFSYKAIAATGLSVGSSTLSGTDDVIYGHGGNSTGSLLNLVNNSGSSFVVDSTGSLNISGAITAGSFNGTLSAADIGAGTFGSNIGVGNYNFNGNLGIGSASPAYKLDVAGTGSFTGTLLVGTPTANSHATTKSYVDSAVSSGVSGGISGTTNYLSKFTSPSTIGNSAIFETGGNVGIGTTNPTQKLELSIGSGDGISLGLRTGVSTNYYIGRVHESSEFGAESAWINFGADASNNNFLAFSTSRYGQEGGERMRIDPAGNVGIGTTSPIGKLQVGDNSATDQFLTFQTNNNSARGINYYLADGTSVRGYLKWDSNEDLFLRGDKVQIDVNGVVGAMVVQESTGNVGIATTTPLAKLHVIGAAKMSNLDGSYRVPVADTELVPRKYVDDNFASITGGVGSAFVQGGNSFGTTAVLGTNDTNDLALETNGATRMTIDSGGSVGIGTTAPATQLHLLDYGAHSPLYIQQTGDFTAAIKQDSNRNGNEEGLGGFQSYWNGTEVGRMLIRSGGDTTNKDDGIITFEVATGGSLSEAMRIEQNGNVGIGTTAPAYKLDVAGTGQFTGTLLVGTPTASGHAATKSYVDSAITSGNADTVDGVHAASFLRSDANDTFTATSLTLDSGAYLNTRLIGSLGTELGIGAGEMWSTMNGSISGEYVWLGGESGVKVVSSPDNMSSGWAGRHEATLIDTAGNSTFPGTLTIGTPTSNAHAATKSYVDSVAGSSSPWTVSGGNIYPSNLTNLVGIGLSNPSSALEVGGTVRLRAGSPDIGIRGTDPNSTGHGVKIYDETDNLEIHFGHNSSTDENYLWDWDGAELKIGVSNAEVARFNASGLEVDTLQAQTSTDLNIDASGGTGNVVITIGN